MSQPSAEAILRKIDETLAGEWIYSNLDICESCWGKHGI